jgi:hypothetical protein
VSAESHAFDGGSNDPTERASPKAGKATREPQILPHSEETIYAGLLEHKAKTLPHRSTISCYVVTEDSGSATGGGQKGGEKKHRRGFSGTVGPEQSDQGSLGYFQVECLQGSRAAIVAPQPLGLDGRR